MEIINISFRIHGNTSMFAPTLFPKGMGGGGGNFVGFPLAS